VIQAIKKLKSLGNTIIVVEHNEEFIKNADWIIEI
jgi:excinuclease ABC subunit A